MHMRQFARTFHLTQLITDNWKKYIAHVLQEEQRLGEKDELSNSMTVPPIVINIGDISTTEEEEKKKKKKKKKKKTWTWEFSLYAATVIKQAQYSDQNRTIQAHLDYLEDVHPIQITMPEMLNTTYIEWQQHIQALPALGKDVNKYGRIMHTHKEKNPEGAILKLEFLGEEVDNTLITQ
ncbi:hypothetical protein C0J52_05585 [Blattella germanica]|nr:hypothetical protein C0J52_05585 [Blattella germanica]